MHLRCKQKFRRTSAQFLVLVSFLLGLGIARTGLEPSLGVVIVSVCLGCFGLIKRNNISMFLLVVCGLMIGCARGAVYMHRLTQYEPYYGQRVQMTITADQDAVYGTRSQLTFDGGDIHISSGKHLIGKVAISGFGTNAVFQGDTVRVGGKLRPGYGAKQGSISFANITVLAHHNSVIASIRRRFAAGMQTALPEPLGSFAMGLLVGQRATLSASAKQDLLMVGLTHIIAVSGYNLTIILHASKKILARRSKRLATLLSFALIAVFLLLAGSSASIVRAAIVSSISIVTVYYGRTVKPLHLIAMAAAITAYAKPIYVWSDISWYLSFLAFFGVMLVAPLLASRMPSRLAGSSLIAVGIESICAEIMSLPIVLFTFGQMSLIGLPANMLVVALVPLAMLLSLLAGLAGMCAPIVAGWVAWPARVLLNYMLDTAHLLANVPHIFVENLQLPLAEMLAWYLGISLFVAALWFKTKQRSAILTDVTDESW